MPHVTSDKILLVKESHVNMAGFNRQRYITLHICSTIGNTSGFPCGLAGKESACNAGDLGSIPGLGRSPGERKGYPLQCSGLENSMDCSPWGHKESDMTERLSLSGTNQDIKSVYKRCY